MCRQVFGFQYLVRQLPAGSSRILQCQVCLPVAAVGQVRTVSNMIGKLTRLLSCLGRFYQKFISPDPEMELAFCRFSFASEIRTASRSLLPLHIVVLPAFPLHHIVIAQDSRIGVG